MVLLEDFDFLLNQSCLTRYLNLLRVIDSYAKLGAYWGFHKPPDFLLLLPKKENFAIIGLEVFGVSGSLVLSAIR